MVSVRSIASFHTRLHRWYAAHGRKDLPWRNTRDAYTIYVSEIMLQQTQVKTVLERFYGPFLAAFPTLASLAAASQDAVLQQWQGLGYYTRAINLHKAAKACGDALPGSSEALQLLPGIGRNTACAVAAFAYGEAVPVMEANVRRVLSRIFALRVASETELWYRAVELLDRQEPFDYNQAMMDIGAMVCTKRAPLCGECPANGICAGKASPLEYPAAKVRKTVPVRRKRIVVFQDVKGRYYAVARSSRFLHGMYHFVELEEGAASVAFGGEIYDLKGAKALGQVRQQYSHFTLEADIVLVAGVAAEGGNWVDFESLSQLPMSMAEGKILALIQLRL
jgi:A/G-specific adenine glycosylase